VTGSGEVRLTSTLHCSPGLLELPSYAVATTRAVIRRYVVPNHSVISSDDDDRHCPLRGDVRGRTLYIYGRVRQKLYGGIFSQAALEPSGELGGHFILARQGLPRRSPRVIRVTWLATI
jgi:hypothetical protein